ncbi:hypothetical protein CTAYLR_009891 [Chrysophaeum taylorii]|uniref:Protein kinase domain-containing protein n=1 Tax=Chrysophaeum taylorii TaxID=2483200 RepID=A0AAD7XP12_9STRA|nr:hypothetical protein CTAYLR_009891 [Chrysophaeum taylorii]
MQFERPRPPCTDRKNLDEAQDLVRGALSPDARNDGRLQSLVEQRDKARSAYVQALISLQTRYSSSDIGVERLVLEQDARRFEACLLALDNIRDDFFEAANPAAAAAAAANPAAVQAESASSLDSTTITIQAVRAFEHWEKITDPRAVSEPTNVAFADAWRKLCDVGEARGAKEARDAWEIAYRAALEAADREVEHWSSHSHPLSMLPVDAIRLAATARLEACRDNLLVLSRAQDQVLEARRDVEDIAVAESKAAAGEKPLREANKWSRTARKKFRESVRDLEDAQDEVEDAKMRDLEEVGGHEEEKGPDIDLLTERVRVARQEVHRAQRAAEDELSTYVELVRDHFPELGLCCAMEAIEAVVALSPALRSVVRQERSPQDYEKIPWPDYYSEPRASRHEVVACLYDGQACVLKQFHLRGASERRALEREVEVLVALAHPNILKLECVFFVEKNELASAEAFIQSPLYCGGSLRQWLSRPENRIDDGCAMEAESVAQWGGLRFLKAEKSRRVATTHVRALKQLLAALSHVHAKGVVHGDVKLDNALVDDPPDGTWTVILIDFDMSRTTTTTTTRDDGESITSAAATTRAGGGTPGYIAPEVLDGENGFDGCFALTCHRPGCGCAFCAYCLADCGADAHHHVGKCALGRGLFPRRPRETLERAQRARRDRDLRAYLLTLADDEARTVLVAGLSTELSDLGLDPLAYLPR